MPKPEHPDYDSLYCTLAQHRGFEGLLDAGVCLPHRLRSCSHCKPKKSLPPEGERLDRLMWAAMGLGLRIEFAPLNNKDAIRCLIKVPSVREDGPGMWQALTGALTKTLKGKA